MVEFTSEEETICAFDCTTVVVNGVQYTAELREKKISGQGICSFFYAAMFQ